MNTDISQILTPSGRISALHFSNMLKQEKDEDKKNDLIAEAFLLLQEENIKRQQEQENAIKKQQEKEQLTKKDILNIEKEIIGIKENIRKIEENIIRIEERINKMDQNISESKLDLQKTINTQTKWFIGLLTAYTALIISLKFL